MANLEDYDDATLTQISIELNMFRQTLLYKLIIEHFTEMAQASVDLVMNHDLSTQHQLYAREQLIGEARAHTFVPQFFDQLREDIVERLPEEKTNN